MTHSPTSKALVGDWGGFNVEAAETERDKRMSEENLFDEAPGQALAMRNDAAAVARATQEIQAALVIAKRFERDEIKAKSKIIEACGRKELAEVAEYEYSRGGTRITGPTIDLLRAIANRWGNIRYGWAEVDRRDGASSVRCFAWDMQTNGQAERTFTIKHWRDTQTGGYALEDERDIYEMIANQAARRVRACLEEVIDADVVSAAVDQCRMTLKKGETVPLKDRAVKMLVPFAEFGVTQAMIETRLGNKLDAVSENQLASLRRVYKSLKDGVGKREDYFKAEVAKPEFKPEPAPAASDAAAEAAAGLAPEPPQNGGGFNPLKAVRNLCRESKIREGKLIETLSQDGTIPDGFGSLDELALSNGGMTILKAISDNWKSVAEKMGGAK